MQALSDCHEEKVTCLSEWLEKELYNSTSAGKTGAVPFMLEHVVKQSPAFKNFINSGEMITKLYQILVSWLSKNTARIISAL